MSCRLRAGHHLWCRHRKAGSTRSTCFVSAWDQRARPLAYTVSKATGSYGRSLAETVGVGERWSFAAGGGSYVTNESRRRSLSPVTRSEKFWESCLANFLIVPRRASAKCL